MVLSEMGAGFTSVFFPPVFKALNDDTTEVSINVNEANGCVQ